uniref:Ankyrin repeat and SOCS box protein 9 isoform X4-like n=1 Tax=Sus scrofa TaxID=9823 RepID=A0A480ZM80_PIG
MLPILLTGIKSSPVFSGELPFPPVDAFLLGTLRCSALSWGCLGSAPWLTLCCSHDCLGASVNQGRGLDSPLHAVARASSGELACLLLEFGADTQARNAEGKRPLELVPPESPLSQLFLQREGASPLPEPKP